MKLIDRFEVLYDLHSGDPKTVKAAKSRVSRGEVTLPHDLVPMARHFEYCAEGLEVKLALLEDQTLIHEFSYIITMMANIGKSLGNTHISKVSADMLALNECHERIQSVRGLVNKIDKKFNELRDTRFVPLYKEMKARFDALFSRDNTAEFDDNLVRHCGDSLIVLQGIYYGKLLDCSEYKTNPIDIANYQFTIAELTGAEPREIDARFYATKSRLSSWLSLFDHLSLLLSDTDSLQADNGLIRLSTQYVELLNFDETLNYYESEGKYLLTAESQFETKKQTPLLFRWLGDLEQLINNLLLTKQKIIADKQRIPGFFQLLGPRQQEYEYRYLVQSFIAQYDILLESVQSMIDEVKVVYDRHNIKKTESVTTALDSTSSLAAVFQQMKLTNEVNKHETSKAAQAAQTTQRSPGKKMGANANLMSLSVLPLPVATATDVAPRSTLVGIPPHSPVKALLASRSGSPLLPDYVHTQRTPRDSDNSPSFKQPIF